MEKEEVEKKSFLLADKQWLQHGFTLPDVFFKKSFKAVNSRWCEATLKEIEKKKKKVFLVDYGVQILQ